MSMLLPVDTLGDELSVLIDCESNGLNNFLAFACWYSLRQHLPDAQVAVSCVRPDSFQALAFPWVHRLEIPFFYYQNLSNSINSAAKIAIERKLLKRPLMVLPSHTMCLYGLTEDILTEINQYPNRIFDGEKFSFHAKGNESGVTFCSLKEGCGSFQPSSWIDNRGHPFSDNQLSEKGCLTISENQIFSLWKKLCPLYEAVI